MQTLAAGSSPTLTAVPAPTIPAHRELKIGLLKAAIRKAGLTEEEFLDLL